jgi:precorrin-4 methylase
MPWFNRPLATRLSPWLALALATGLVMTMAMAAAPCRAESGRGKLYVIGLGPAGPQTATLQALQTIRRMDALVSRPRHLEPFAEYIGDTPVWFDHLAGLWDYQGKFFTQLGPEKLAAFQARRRRLTEERLARIQAFLAQGKNLGMLESGNPCVFSSSHWYTERLDPADVVFIAGMGSDAAAMAAVGASTIPAHRARFLLQSAPFVITDDGRDLQALKDLAPHRPTMIFYMALKKPGPFFRALRQAFSPQTPCATVYYAGFPDKEKVVRGTLADMPAKLAREPERYFGLLLVGDFLRGSPYLAAEQ